jgi:hypothetical protein
VTTPASPPPAEVEIITNPADPTVSAPPSTGVLPKVMVAALVVVDVMAKAPIAAARDIVVFICFLICIF